MKLVVYFIVYEAVKQSANKYHHAFTAEMMSSFFDVVHDVRYNQKEKIPHQFLLYEVPI